MASARARALAMRRPKSSHQSGDPTAAPSSLKLADTFQLHPGKLSGPKDCDVVHAGMTSVLLRLTTRPLRLRPWTTAERKKLTAGAVPAKIPSSR